jgi:hypothetical protein
VVSRSRSRWRPRGVLAMHRQIEAGCLAECRRRSRTWHRMTMDDREALVNAQLATFPLEDRDTWALYFTWSDVIRRESSV